MKQYVVVLTVKGELQTLQPSINLGPFGIAPSSRSCGQLMEEEYIADAHKFETKDEVFETLRHWKGTPYHLLEV